MGNGRSIWLVNLFLCVIVATSASIAVEPPVDERRLKTLRQWCQRAQRDGWPLSNLGDANLNSVVFLYDVAITAQFHLAEGREDEARRLLLKVAAEWPRSDSGFVASIKLPHKEAFDQINGRPVVTNGPAMHVAISALTVWASKAAGLKNVETSEDRSRELPELSRSIAEHILAQMNAEGGIPYGPGGQTFGDGTPFNQVFNPEYQCNFIGLTDRLYKVTGDKKWHEASKKALDFLVKQHFDRRQHRFVAINSHGREDYPPDVPGWAISLIGPDRLQAANIDLERLAEHLAADPSQPMLVEWQLNRIVGLSRLAKFFRDNGNVGAASKAELAVSRFSKLINTIPLREPRHGAGLAYAYQRAPGRDDAFIPADGVDTNWGWTTQAGSSRISAAYWLCVVAGHDPVGAEIRGRAINWQAIALRERPQRSSTGQREFRKPPPITQTAGTSYRHDQWLRNETQSLNFALAHVATHPCTNFSAPALFRLGGDVRKWSAAELEDLLVHKKGWSRLETWTYLRQVREVGSAKRRGLVCESVFEDVARDKAVRVLVFDAFDVRVVARFEHLLPQSETAKKKASFQAWAEHHQLVADPSRIAWVPNEQTDDTTVRRIEIGDSVGYVCPLQRPGWYVIAVGAFATVDPVSYEMTGLWQGHPTWSRLHLAAKYPVTNGVRRDTEPVAKTREFGEDYQWVKLDRIDLTRFIGLDIRTYDPNAKKLDDKIGDKLIFGAEIINDSPEAFRRSAQIAVRGAFRGMVAAPVDLNSQVMTPGRMYARPEVFGDRILHSPYLDQVARRLEANPDSKQDWQLCLDRGRLVLGWLSDMRAEHELRLARHRSTRRIAEIIDKAAQNYWISNDDAILVVGRQEYKRAVQRYNKLLTGDHTAALALYKRIKFAKDNGLHLVDPQVSQYESTWIDFLNHLGELQSKIEKNSDSIRGEEFMARYQRDARQLRFRRGNQFFAIFPGYRQTRECLAIIEHADRIADERRRVKSPSGLKLFPFEKPANVKPAPARNLFFRYEKIADDDKGRTWVAVSHESGRLDRYEVLDYRGIKRFEVKHIGNAPDTNNGLPVFNDVLVTKISSDGAEIIPINAANMSQDQLLSEARRKFDGGVVPTVVTKRTANGFSESIRYQSGPDDPTVFVRTHVQPNGDAVVVRRNYPGGGRETLSGHVFDRSTGVYWPRLILSFDDQGQVFEKRVLKGTPYQTATYEVYYKTTELSNVWDFIPFPIKRLLPLHLVNIPRFELRRVDVLESDGMLRSRTTRPLPLIGEEGKPTYAETTVFDVDKQRRIFAWTGQIVHIPKHTSSNQDARPFVFYHAEYDDPRSGLISSLVVYELNGRATYSLDQYDGPVPHEITVLEEKHNLTLPALKNNRKFHWRRRTYVFGNAGRRNQRGEPQPQMALHETEDQRQVVTIDWIPNQGKPNEPENNRAGYEESRRVAWKLPGGKLYGGPDSSGVALSDVPPSRYGPRHDHENWSDRCYSLIGRANIDLTPNGYLPITIQRYASNSPNDQPRDVMRIVYEDSSRRNVITHELIYSPKNKGEGNSTIEGAVISVVPGSEWLWEPYQRRWVPRVIRRFQRLRLFEVRELVPPNEATEGEERRGSGLTDWEGNVTYRVTPHDGSALPEDEQYEEVVQPDGFVRLRRSIRKITRGNRQVPRVVTTLSVNKRKDLFLESGDVPEIAEETEIDGFRMLTHHAKLVDDHIEISVKHGEGQHATELITTLKRVPHGILCADPQGRFIRWRPVKTIFRDKGAALRISEIEYTDPEDDQIVSEEYRRIYEVDLDGKEHFFATASPLGRSKPPVDDDATSKMVQVRTETRSGAQSDEWLDRHGRTKFWWSNGILQRAVGGFEFAPMLMQWRSQTTTTSERGPRNLLNTRLDLDTTCDRRVFESELQGQVQLPGLPFQTAHLRQTLQTTANTASSSEADYSTIATHSYLDFMGRTWLRRTVGNLVTAVEHYPQFDTTPLKTRTPGSHLPFVGRDKVLAQPGNFDFLVIHTKRMSVDDVRLRIIAQTESGSRELIVDGVSRTDTTTQTGARSQSGVPGIAFWEPEFDEPIILTDATGPTPIYCLLASCPMDAGRPLISTRSEMVALHIPIHHILSALHVKSIGSISIVADSKFHSSAVWALGQPRPVNTNWIYDPALQRRNAADLETIPNLDEWQEKIVSYPHNVTVVFKGSGSLQSATVYAHGRRVSKTFWVKIRNQFRRIRHAFHVSASAELTVPLFTESDFDGWLASGFIIEQKDYGRLLLQLPNPHELLSVSLIPSIDVSASDDSLLGRGPFLTYYLPGGEYDPGVRFGGVRNNIVSRVWRTYGPPSQTARANGYASDSHTLLRSSAATPGEFRKLIENARLNVLLEYPNAPDESETADPALPLLGQWRDRTLGLLGNGQLLVPTHPGSKRASSAETWEEGEIVLGLLAAGELGAAIRIIEFYDSATGGGSRPCLDAYDVRYGTARGFRKLPTRSQPSARGSISIARAALALARTQSNDHRSLEMARGLTQVLLHDYLSDSDLLWSPNATSEDEIRGRSDNIASALCALLGTRSRKERILCSLTDTPSADYGNLGDARLRESISLQFSRILARASLQLRDPDAPHAEIRSEVLTTLGQSIDGQSQGVFSQLCSLSGGVTENAVSRNWFSSRWDSSSKRGPIPVFHLTTNAEFLALLHEWKSWDLRCDPQFRALIDNAFQVQKEWFERNVFPVVRKHRGLAPSIWRHQFEYPSYRRRPGNAPAVLGSNRWPTLAASIAASEARLLIEDNDDARKEVGEWLQRQARVFAWDGTGLDYVPVTHARYQGQLRPVRLSARFGALARRLDDESGEGLAKRVLAAALVQPNKSGVGSNQGMLRGVILRQPPAAIFRNGDPVAAQHRNPVDTGDGRVVYVGHRESQWSPTATLAAIEMMEPSVESVMPRSVYPAALARNASATHMSRVRSRAIAFALWASLVLLVLRFVLKCWWSHGKDAFYRVVLGRRARDDQADWNRSRQGSNVH